MIYTPIPSHHDITFYHDVISLDSLCHGCLLERNLSPDSDGIEQVEPHEGGHATCTRCGVEVWFGDHPKHDIDVNHVVERMAVAYVHAHRAATVRPSMDEAERVCRLLLGVAVWEILGIRIDP